MVSNQYRGYISTGKNEDTYKLVKLTRNKWNRDLKNSKIGHSTSILPKSHVKLGNRW